MATTKITAMMQMTPETSRQLIVSLDLSDYAGQNIKLDVVNQPSGWAYEAAYWAKINSVTQ